MFIEKKVSDYSVSTELHEIRQIRFLTEETFVLRFDRRDLEFRAGQHIIVGLEGELNQREYSIYSGEKDDYIDILVREVAEGNVSVRLKQCKPGQMLLVNGPFGTFGLEEFDMFSRKLVFVATGTGISPFHSFIKSYPGIEYTLFHGVRYSKEAYDKIDYAPRRFFICTSKESTGGDKGRVTKFLTGYPVSTDILFYLCGNNNMIYDVSHLLRDKGIPVENIFSEVYF